MSSSASADDTAALHGIRSDSGYGSSSRSSRGPTIPPSKSSGLNGRFDRMTAAMSAVAGDARPLDESGSSRGVTRVSIAPSDSLARVNVLSGRKRMREEDWNGEGEQQDGTGRRRREGREGPRGSVGSIGDSFELLDGRDARRREVVNGMVEGVEEEEGSFLEIRHELSPSGSGKRRTSVRDRRVPEGLPRAARVASLERPPWMRQPTTIKQSPPTPPPAWLARHLSSHSTPPLSSTIDDRPSLRPSSDVKPLMDVDGYPPQDSSVEAYSELLHCPNRPETLPFSTSGRLAPRTPPFGASSSPQSVWEDQMRNLFGYGRGSSSSRRFDDARHRLEMGDGCDVIFDSPQFSNLSLDHRTPTPRLHPTYPDPPEPAYELDTSNRFQPSRATAELLVDTVWEGLQHAGYERRDPTQLACRPEDSRANRPQSFASSFDPLPPLYPALSSDLALPVLSSDRPSDFWKPANRPRIQPSSRPVDEIDVYSNNLLRDNDDRTSPPLPLAFTRGQPSISSERQPSDSRVYDPIYDSIHLSPSSIRGTYPNPVSIVDRPPSLSPLDLPHRLAPTSAAAHRSPTLSGRPIGVVASSDALMVDDGLPLIIRMDSPRRGAVSPAPPSLRSQPAPHHAFPEHGMEVDSGQLGESTALPSRSEIGVDGHQAGTGSGWKFDWDVIEEEEDGTGEARGAVQVDGASEGMGSFEIFEDPVAA